MESYNALGICADRVDNMAEAKYQALHNQMVACARVCRYAHSAKGDSHFCHPLLVTKVTVPFGMSGAWGRTSGRAARQKM